MFPVFGETLYTMLLGAAIWIPYINIADRVKRTFVFTYNKKEQPEPGILVGEEE